MSDDFNSDKKSEKPNLKDSPKDEVDQLKEESGKGSEKIKKMEEKITDQQKTNVSMKNYLSERTTLVLSIVVGLLGFMGVGHLYVGRVRRGIIILIIGLFSSWTMLFIALVMYAMVGEIEEDTLDVAPAIGILVGYMVVGIGILALYIWQILNSRKLCKEYNEFLEQHGRAPW